MVLFTEINQAPSPYSMLQHIGRVATPKLVPKNCLRYMQTTLIMGGGGSVSEFMWGIVGKSEKFNNQEMKENRAFRILFINKKQLQRWQALHRIFLKPQYKLYIGASILYFNASFSDVPYFSKISQLPG